MPSAELPHRGCVEQHFGTAHRLPISPREGHPRGAVCVKPGPNGCVASSGGP